MNPLSERIQKEMPGRNPCPGCGGRHTVLAEGRDPAGRALLDHGLFAVHRKISIVDLLNG